LAYPIPHTPKNKTETTPNIRITTGLNPKGVAGGYTVNQIPIATNIIAPSNINIDFLLLISISILSINTNYLRNKDKGIKFITVYFTIQKKKKKKNRQ
jgi:hypothetical protein